MTSYTCHSQTAAHHCVCVDAFSDCNDDKMTYYIYMASPQYVCVDESSVYSGH
jgi:hypothetical protein